MSQSWWVCAEGHVRLTYRRGKLHEQKKGRCRQPVAKGLNMPAGWPPMSACSEHTRPASHAEVTAYRLGGQEAVFALWAALRLAGRR